jgi:hypothetical protein
VNAWLHEEFEPQEAGGIAVNEPAQQGDDDT